MRRNHGRCRTTAVRGCALFCAAAAEPLHLLPSHRGRIPRRRQVQKSQTTIPVTVNLVDVLFTVLDRRNKLVPGLEQQDFKFLDDNVPQDIRYFSKQNGLLLRIGMLLDTSNSIRDRLKFEQDAANNFLFSVLRRNKDEAFVMTFDDEPQLLQGFTGDTGPLRDRILRTRRWRRYRRLRCNL